jgi:hypothetical protein
MKNDPDYRSDQKDGQRCWIEKHPGYWREYRENHQDYVSRNRLLQKGRDQRRRHGVLAKMDASNPDYVVQTGTYYVIPAKKNLAKMDALFPLYFLIPNSSAILAKEDSIDFSSVPQVDSGTKEVVTDD